MGSWALSRAPCCHSTQGDVSAGTGDVVHRGSNRRRATVFMSLCGRKYPVGVCALFRCTIDRARPGGFSRTGSCHSSACGFRRQDVCLEHWTAMPVALLDYGILHLEFDARVHRGGTHCMALVLWPILN